MDSTFPKDVYSEITDKVMAYSKGTQGEERESLRKLRDSTLLSLSLTSKEISSVSLPALYRNVTAYLYNSRLLLPQTTIYPSPFIQTRSLRWGFPEAKENLTREEFFKCVQNDNEASHPDLVLLQKENTKAQDELARVSGHSTSYQSAQKKAIDVNALRAASILSILIESMPNLQSLESDQHSNYWFAKLHICQETGFRFSRPLSGLLNLKVLKVEECLPFVMTATNCTWLMLFLPRLTHLAVLFTLNFKDEQFLLDHQEVLVGKSKVTHLDLTYGVEQSKKRNWPRALTSNTETLELLLGVTKGLVELKIHNLVPPTTKMLMVASLAFLRCLKASFESLKYLYLLGDFNESMMNIRSNQSQAPVKLIALEMISLDRLSVRAFSMQEISASSRIELDLPNATAAHLVSESGHYLDRLKFPETAAAKWINSKSFPSTIKTILLPQKPIDADGRVINLGDKTDGWRKARADLLSLCKEKGLEVKILREGEQIPFGVMPEPEDLLQ